MREPLARNQWPRSAWVQTEPASRRLPLCADYSNGSRGRSITRANERIGLGSSAVDAQNYEGRSEKIARSASYHWIGAVARITWHRHGQGLAVLLCRP